MSESPGPASPSPKPERSALHQRLDRLVGRAQWTLLWERAWPRLWFPLAILVVFLTASWLGLWVDAAPLMRTTGMGLFTAAFILSLWPLTRLRLPGRTSALDRLDRDTGLPHGPARALDDTLTLGRDDPGTRALWDLHRRRSETAIARLRVSAPRPDMPRRDRFAVRSAAVLAMVASAFVAGPELGPRLSAAFDWREPQAAAPNFRVDGWIDPPLYTRTPPLMIDLAGGEQRLRAPVRSTVVIRVAGEGDVTITPGPGLTAQPVPENQAQRAGLREQRFTLEGDGELQVKTGIASGVRLKVEAIPDRAPEIAWVKPPEVNQRGSFELTYRGKDDYGITAAEGTVEKGEALTGKRTLVPAPALPVAVPDTAAEDGETKAPVDLTNHPWAGARVKLGLIARDDAGQEGRSPTIDFTLPQRPFTKPLAKSLVEQRRKLVLDPDDRRRVQIALDALLIAPETFTKEWGVFMGLRTASERLRRAKGDPELVEVADWLWAMAVQIEDGDLSDAERELRAAQDRLREAMDRNASPDEIQRLMNELRQAMDKFLREFAERMQRQQQQGETNPNSQQPQRTITQNDLNRMMQEMEQAMRRGDMAEAQRLLEELRNIMENLQTAQRNNRMSDPMAREMQRSMEDLDAMAREQQQLRDETFRDGQQRRMQQGQRGQRQQQGQRGQQGQRQRGQQPGQQGEPGEGEEQAENGQQGQQGQQGQGQGLSQRQQALRERLQELQRRMRGMGMQGEQGLGDAEQAMREAEGALGQGQDGPAVDAQGRALEGLQRGMQGMAQQMQQMQQPGDGNEQAGNEPGQGDPQGRGQAGQRDTDPLGRPTRSRDFQDNSRVQVPRAGESPSQRAQRILEELRRKLGEATRPREELEYFERLLRPR
jgi:uncharacterized protein (TIGR02302 family)